MARARRRRSTCRSISRFWPLRIPSDALFSRTPPVPDDAGRRRRHAGHGTELAARSRHRRSSARPRAPAGQGRRPPLHQATRRCSETLHERPPFTPGRRPPPPTISPLPTPPSSGGSRSPTFRCRPCAASPSPAKARSPSWRWSPKTTRLHRVALGGEIAGWRVTAIQRESVIFSTETIAGQSLSRQARRATARRDDPPRRRTGRKGRLRQREAGQWPAYVQRASHSAASAVKKSPRQITRPAASRST